MIDVKKLAFRSEEHTSELQSHVRISYAVFCLQKKKNTREVLAIKKTIILGGIAIEVDC